MNITIIGDGGWGTAIGLLLHAYGHRVTLWGPFATYLDEVRAARENTRYLPGIALPDGLRWCADPAEAAAGTEAVVLAVPSKFYAAVCASFAGLIPATTAVGMPRATSSAWLGPESTAIASSPSVARAISLMRQCVSSQRPLVMLTTSVPAGIKPAKEAQTAA